MGTRAVWGPFFVGLVAAACGARTGLDASPRVAAGDAGDAQAPPMCVPGGVAAGAERVEPFPSVARLGVAAVFDPERRGLFFVGGHDPLGRRTGDVVYQDVNRHAMAVLPLVGDAFTPTTLHRAVWDPLHRRVIVLGGAAVAGAADTAQAVALAPEGASLRVRRLPDFPTGSVFLPPAAVDPRRNRLVVWRRVQGVGDEARENGLFALDLTPGAERWSVLLPGTSPPPGLPLEMVYDPAGDGFLMVSIVDGRSVLHRTGAAAPAAWVPVPGDLPQGPRMPPRMVWDARTCSFLLVVNQGCTRTLWQAAIGDGIQATLLGVVTGVTDRGAITGLFHDPSPDRLLLTGGTRCSQSDAAVGAVDVVPLLR